MIDAEEELLLDEQLDFKDLEVKLSKYKWYFKQAKMIELSIRHPYKEEDGNIGGSRSVSIDNDGMLQTLVKMQENERLQEYIGIGLAAQRTYEVLPDHLQETMLEFYINRKGHYRGHPKRCAAKLNVDVKTLYRWRWEIIHEFNKQLSKDARVCPSSP